MVFAMFHLCRRSPESIRIGPFWPGGLMPATPMLMSRLVALSLTFSCLVIVRSNLPIRPHLISWVRYCIQTKLCAFCEFRLSAWGRRPGLPWSPSGPVAWNSCIFQSTHCTIFHLKFILCVGFSAEWAKHLFSCLLTAQFQFWFLPSRNYFARCS